MHEYISGIQQIGIGVKNATESLHHYAKLFGMDTLVFDDTSDAKLMTRYTGGSIYNRHALLSINMQGGGGFEIWQYKDRQPVEPAHQPDYGDLGIYAAKIKCGNIRKAYEMISQNKQIITSDLQKDHKGGMQFWMRDAYQNVFNIVEGSHWFQKTKHIFGGVSGVVIGVSHMDQSIEFYRNVLNIKQVTYDETGLYTSGISNVTRQYRRVLLQKHPSGKGAFNKLLGSVEIELVQCLDREPLKIYANRFWGDCGFIHLCLDVFNMCGLKTYAEKKGYPFTVDSLDSFDMDNASGRFSYMEDPDGTLIELVETHKVPVFKKLGIFLHLKKRNLEKPLPDWMIKLLAISKIK